MSIARGTCAHCHADLALTAGRPRIVAGQVQLWCVACAGSGTRAKRSTWQAVASVADAAVQATRQAVTERPTVTGRRREWRVGMRASLAVGALVLATGATLGLGRGEGAPQRVTAVDLSSEEVITLETSLAMPDDAPPVRPEYRVPVRQGAALDERYPSLRDWIHPVSDAAELVPIRGSRKFGAARSGVERTECGDGHCGVDLDGPKGRPIVAVATGTVVRVEETRDGRDGRSGRYVKLRHDDGAFTAYMHLDTIVTGLTVGDRLAAGDVLGTLGATGVKKAEPHLHFQLDIPAREGAPVEATRFIDPTPYLHRARIVPNPARVTRVGA